MARFLLLVLSSFATSAVYVIDAANATSSPPLSSPMQPEDPPNGVFYQDFHGYLCLGTQPNAALGGKGLVNLITLLDSSFYVHHSANFIYFSDI
jgi:hypothetical protein